MNAHEAFRDGRLRDAVSAMTQEVRSRPSDADKRWLLAEFLALAGDFDRVEKMLAVVETTAPDAAASVALFRGLVRGERLRRRFHEEGGAPTTLGTASAGLAARAGLPEACLRGDARAAAEALAAAEAGRPALRGTCDGRKFDGLRDLDDVSADVLEVITGAGEYAWAPLELVVSVRFAPIARARDLLWRRAQLVMSGRPPQGEVFVPALYPTRPAADDDASRLGRATSWTESAGGVVRGVGQRVLLVGDEERPFLEIGEMRFGGGDE